MLAPKITTHVQDALARFLQQYKGQPNLTALMTALVEQIQDLEDAVFDLDAGRQITNAIGAQLDGIGQLVGVSRNGLSDVEFLVFILGTIAEDNSDTTIPTMLNVVSTIFKPIVLTFKEMFPGEVGIGIGGSAIGLAAGQPIAGGVFPSGTTITNIITQPVTQIGHVAFAGSTITGLDTGKLTVGMIVTGSSFSGVAAIVSIDSSSQVTVTNTATSSTGNYTLTFSAVLSMSNFASFDGTGIVFNTLDAFGNIQNIFTGNTRQGAPGITDFQVQLSSALEAKIGDILQNSLGASIVLGFLTFFDAANSFACGDLVGETSPLYAGSSGCGDVFNTNTGGQLASLIFSSLPE